MSDMFLAQYAKVEIALTELKNRIARNERGADILEWVGVMVLAAVIIVGLSQLVGDGQAFKDVIDTAIDKVKGIG